MEGVRPDKTVDCTGLYCPMPIVNAKREIASMEAGQVLEVLADDPGFKTDLPAWCKLTSNEFLGIEEDGDLLKGYVRKSPRAE